MEPKRWDGGKLVNQQVKILVIVLLFERLKAYQIEFILYSRNPQNPSRTMFGPESTLLYHYRRLALPSTTQIHYRKWNMQKEGAGQLWGGRRELGGNQQLWPDRYVLRSFLFSVWVLQWPIGEVDHLCTKDIKKTYAESCGLCSGWHLLC